MKIISIVWYKVLPPHFGGQKGIAFFNEELALHHPLVCICSDNNQPSPGLPYRVINSLPSGKKQFILPSCWKKIKCIAAEEKATHIILEHPYHGIAAVKAAKTTGAKLILHAHNIESERFREIGKWWWKLLQYYERWVQRKADLILFKTTADKQWAIRHFGISEDKCMVVPYSIEKPALRLRSEQARELIRSRHSIGEKEKILLFAGTLDYEPNADAVKAIVEKIAPALSEKNISFRIIICGRNRFPAFQYLNQLSHPSVIMAGEVEDIGNYFAAADVFINPVQSGGGIQTKTIDALSYDLDTVCFAAHANDIDPALCGNKLFTAKPGDWNDFINKITEAGNRKSDTPQAFFEFFDKKRIIREVAQRMQ